MESQVLEIVLCAWAAVCTIYGLRWLLGPETGGFKYGLNLTSRAKDKELELEVHILSMDGHAWRINHRFAEEDIVRILDTCFISLGIEAPKKENEKGG
jgi:hypothetical protein